MGYKWKPNKAQREAFKQKMKDPAEYEAHMKRKREKEEKRRAGSQFDYNTAGGEYIPTREQYDFCMENLSTSQPPEQRHAFIMVIGGYSGQQKVPHDYIHIVNEARREQLNNNR